VLFVVAPPVSNPPEDTQVDALEELHVNTDDCPTSIVSGVATSDTVGDVYELQVGGLFAPFRHVPSLLVVQAGGLFVPFEHVCAPTVTVADAIADVPPGPVH